MDNDEIPSTSAQHPDTTQQYNTKDQSAIEKVTEFTDSLRQGCVCHNKQQNLLSHLMNQTHSYSDDKTFLSLTSSNLMHCVNRI